MAQKRKSPRAKLSARFWGGGGGGVGGVGGVLGFGGGGWLLGGGVDCEHSNSSSDGLLKNFTIKMRSKAGT